MDTQVTFDSDMSEVDRRGQEIYDRDLRSLLEPARNGEAVAIHLDSGDYVVHRNWARAGRELRQRRPQGFIYTLTIGPPTAEELARAARLHAGAKQ